MAATTIPITFTVTSTDSDRKSKSTGEQNATILVTGVFLTRQITIAILNLGEVRLMLGSGSTYQQIADWCRSPREIMTITHNVVDTEFINWVKTYPDTPFRILFPVSPVSRSAIATSCRKVFN